MGKSETSNVCLTGYTKRVTGANALLAEIWQLAHHHPVVGAQQRIQRLYERL